MKRWNNIIILCTYENLITMYKKVLHEMDIDIDIAYIGNKYRMDMTKLLNHINNFKDLGKDIIITRGFLAQLIKENLDFKVIEISITGIDILKNLCKYINKNLVLGIVECKSFIDTIKPIADLLQIETKSYIVNNIYDFDLCINRAIKENVDVIIGGARKYYDEEFLNKYNINYEFVESSEFSLRNSLENAFQIYDLLYEEKKRKEYMQNIVGFSTEGIIAFDENKNIIELNYIIEDIYNINRKDVIGKYYLHLDSNIELDEIIKTGKSKLSLIKEINNNRVLMNQIPLIIDDNIVGAIITMKKIETIQEDEKKIRTQLNKKGLKAKYTMSDIKGNSLIIKEQKKLASIYSKSDSTVLILGESGTGKEIFAQAIHNNSKRKNNPFVAINCSSYQSSILDSELFGYVEGAFTGAKKGGKIGMFELAHTGTIFLDEIGDMDYTMQSRLLRVIQEREIMRLGDDKVISIDVRIIAATNKNLYREVENGNFREDLYYRLNILNLYLPPLRARKDDIEDIVAISIKNLNKKLHCNVLGIENKIIEKMKTYDWKGNIRELNNILEKMVSIVQYGKICYNQISFIFDEIDYLQESLKQEISKNKKDIIYQKTLKEAEIILIENALKENNYNKSKTADRLGIDRTTLNRKLSKSN